MVPAVALHLLLLLLLYSKWPVHTVSVSLSLVLYTYFVVACVTHVTHINYDLVNREVYVK